jgi:hypothetical protein
MRPTVTGAAYSCLSLTCIKDYKEMSVYKTA